MSKEIKNSCACGGCHDEKHEHNHEHSHDEAHNHENESCQCTAKKDNYSCGCGHEHSHEHSASDIKKDIVKVLFAICLTVLGGFLPLPFAIAVFVIAYIFAGGNVVVNAVKNILRGNWFDENFLMAIATVGAFAIGDFTEAVAVMVFYQIGEILQGLAVSRSRKNIEGLMNIRPEFAVVETEKGEQKVSPESVQIGATLIVRAGEKVPVDCVVLSGTSAVDTSALTGESVPLDAQEGTSLVGGSVNLTGVLRCKATNEFGQSAVQKILNLVEQAGDKKAKAEKLITRLAKIYTPCVIAAALAIAFVPLLFGGNFQDWFYRGLIFLVVSCPCALVVSIPVGFMGGIGGAAKRGVLVKGGDILDSLYTPKAVIFDKTGTLTKGVFAVKQVVAANGVIEDELIKAASICERNSNHPIAVSVRKAFKDKDTGEEILQYSEVAGFGIEAQTQNSTYLAGNLKMMQKNNIENVAQGLTAAETQLHIVQNSKYLGYITIADEIKENTKKAIDELRNLGVEKCFMLTGDNEAVAKAIAQEAGLDGYKAGLLPHEKVEAFETLTGDINGISMFAGDGINDAPLLARADVGIAMGGVGSDAAIEAADIVLMTDDIAKIGDAIRMARKTRTIVWQNIIFAMGVKLIVMVVAAFGAVPMWLAIFADVGVALIAVANAARAVVGK